MAGFVRKRCHLRLRWWMRRAEFWLTGVVLVLVWKWLHVIQAFSKHHEPVKAVDRHNIPSVTVPGVNCSRLFSGDPTETVTAAEKTFNAIPDAYFVQATQNCTDFSATRRYITTPLTVEERDYPFAYSIVMFKDLAQVEMLLRAIYRPQNLYCIHVDVKAHDDVKRGVTALTRCFDNVFTSSRSVDVEWGYFSVVEAELLCMEDLLKRHRTWKYFINLTGQEFPLKTNWQLVRILKALNGSNVISGNIKGKNLRRTKWSYRGLHFQNKLLPPPPYNMTITKGPVHVIATRAFVDYVINSDVSKAFRKWTSHTAVPDETFFSSLNHNPDLGIPGSFKGLPQTSESNPHIQRLKSWAYKGQELGLCQGRIQKQMCIFGVGDLPKFLTTEKLFANKFHWEFQPAAPRCLEQQYFITESGRRSRVGGFWIPGTMSSWSTRGTT